MKHIVRKSALLALSALIGGLALPAAAQTTGADWRPFRAGYTYTYAAGAAQDSLVSFRLTPDPTRPADSIWKFNLVVRPFRTPNDSLCNPPMGWSTFFDYAFHADHEFGRRLWQQAPGVYRFSFSDTAVHYTVRPTAPVGSSWAFGGGQTATLTRRDTMTVAGALDSVAVIGLSGGGSLLLGKRSGLVAGPSLRALRQGRTVPLRLLGAAGLTPALPPNHIWRLYDFQPADEFGYTTEEFPFTNPSWICGSAHERVRVLSRQLDPTGTMLTYDLMSQRVASSYASPTNPYCPGAGPTTVTHPVRRYQLALPLRSTANDDQLLEITASAALGSAQGASWRLDARINKGAHRRAGFVGCVGDDYMTNIEYRLYDSCAGAFGQVIDMAGNSSYWPGFGLVSSSTQSTRTTLAWFRKGNITCGSVAPFAALLSSPVLLPASAVQLYPNPATTTARLNLTGTKGGALTLTATDALGRRVWQHTQVVGAEADIALPVGGWAPGVYYVRVALEEGVRVIRVVRE